MLTTATPPSTAAAQPPRVLAPIRRDSEIEPALRIAAALAGDAAVCFLHVCAAEPHERESAEAAALLARARASSREHGVSSDGYILNGDVAQVIVDAAEMFDCACIVMPRAAGWQRFFSRGTVRKVQRLGSTVPLVQVDRRSRT